jgi:hypothetical protein
MRERPMHEAKSLSHTDCGGDNTGLPTRAAQKFQINPKRANDRAQIRQSPRATVSEKIV